VSTREHASAFGAQLRALRLRSGLSQEALAERAGLGTGAVAALERGSRRSPYPSTLGALAEALGLSPEERSAFAQASRRTPEPPRDGAATARRHPRVRAPLTTLVGREADLAAAHRLLDPADSSARLLTLVGPGGVGKTALGLRVAWELQPEFDAAWLVELAPIADAALVPETVAATLSAPESPGRSAFDSLEAFLQPTSALLVLDNCEHVLDACLELATHLLAACPRLRLLTTSREPLQMPGERVLRLAALGVPDPDEAPAVERLSEYAAVRLFVERVRAFDPSFQLTPANAASVAQVCGRLEGIPLALELAAARLQVLSLEQLVARLDRVFAILGGGSSAAPTRQQTMQATLDWSYGLLAQPEQAVFRRLAVVAGSCELEAAEAICQTHDLPSADVLDLIARLVSKSLVVVDTRGHLARYRLLEPVRQYAESRLRASDEEVGTRTQHANWYLALAERISPELAGPDQTDGFAQLDAERDNLRAAARWLRDHETDERELRLVIALAPYWEARGHLSEGRRQLEAALASPQATSARIERRRDALQAAGQLAHWQADLDGSQALLEQSLGLSHDLDDASGAANTLIWLGTLARRRGRHAESAALLRQSIGAQRALGNQRGLAQALLTCGVTLVHLRDLSTARSMLEESLGLFRQAGDVRYVAMTLTMLGHCLIASGDASGGSLRLAEGVLGHRKVGDLSFLHFGLSGLAQAAAAQSRPQRAARLLGASESVRVRIGAAHALINRESHDRLVAKLRARLTEDAFSAAMAAGAALSVDEAIDEALAIAEPSPEAATAVGSNDARLTAREREVVALLARGLSDRQIAEALSISVGTVGVHVQNLLRKLDLHSRWQVADRATSRDIEIQ